MNAGASGTGVKSETDLMQECMSAMLDETRKLNAAISGKSAESADRKIILEFAEKLKDIHSRLVQSFNPNEGRSKILERFFTQWNNMLFGVFYSVSEMQSKGFITNRQYEIFTMALDEIIKTLEKNPIMARRSAPAREQTTS